MSRLPEIGHKHKICVICEGLEEDIYFKRLLLLNVWSSIYDFIPINAKSESNIFARFQDAYNKDCYEAILIFCDTDKNPYKEYSQLKRKINDFFGNELATQKIILWANPCSMQIILSHFGDVSLTRQGKKTNADTIEQMTGVRNYDAHEEQINEICNKIYRRTYPEMKERLRADDYDETRAGTSNMVYFVELFEDDSTSWISEINKCLDQTSSI